MRQSTYENEDENENFVRKRNAIVTKTEDNTEAPQKNKEAPQKILEAPQQNKEALQQKKEAPQQNKEAPYEILQYHSGNSLTLLRNFSNVTKIFF